MITNPSPYNLWLLIILKVLLIKSEKRFEDYKILDPETSEINRKKLTKIVKSEINKISQICENSHNALYVKGH